MKMKNIILKTLLVAVVVCFAHTAYAQHTFGLSGGVGSFTSRLYPEQKTRITFGAPNFGLSWRYYSLPRYVGAVGADLEFMQRGFSFGYSYSTSMDENGMEQREYYYYTRRLNSIMLPIIWQPHVYLAKRHVRLYLEAAFTLSYNFGGDYEYDDTGKTGDYDWKNVRDNRFNYGLAGGGGFALLFGRYEIGVRARYYFGYADILRNRNKYYDNATDGPENPFRLTPLRSPLDNLNFSVTMAYRFNKDGFEEWFYKPKKRDRTKREFRFSQSGDMKSSSSGSRR
ncbi:MAG: outer membrane beta-barrel protein [Alistipes sp.]|nr:PorT family protein [Rikenellaceae bacterium]MBQ7964361.1 outer membrane beta-barrel protein [Alistipes sp.]